MKEHEDDVMLSDEKSNVTVGSTIERDEGEDMMVDVVGADDVEYDHVDTEVNLQSKAGSDRLVEECLRKETEIHDINMQDSDEIRVLAVEKAEVVLNDDGLKTTAEVSTDILQDNVVTTVASGSNVDIAVIDSKESTGGLTKDVVELHVESVEEDEILETSKIAEPLITKNSSGLQEVMSVVLNGKDEAENSITVDPSLVACANNQISPVEVVNSVSDEGDINAHTEDQNEQIEVETLNKSDDAQKVENGDKLAVEYSSVEPNSIDKEEIERGLTKVEESVDQPIVSVQEVNYVNGVIIDKTEKEDKVLDSSKIPESLTSVNFGQHEVNSKTPIGLEEVKHPEFSYEDADLETGDEVLGSSKIPESLTKINLGQHEVNSETPLPDEVKHQEYSFEDDAGVDIDEVMGWKDEIPEIDGINSDPEKDQNFNNNSNSEDLQQKLPEPSAEQTLNREPIVYGRRAHVEVPLYDPMVEITPTLLADENLETETDSDEDYESVQEEHNITEQFDENSFSLNQFNYFQPPKIEGEFSVSDLVWGKVRSHPWWPGQIINPSDASQKAMKYHKKDSFLVAYFGDHTFAWNNSTVLKPFRANFSQIEKQTNLEPFKIAVECALEEVTRRVELGLACSCVPDDIYKKIEYQVLENGGVRKKASRRNGLDESANVNSFEPDKLVDYVRLLAQFPNEADKMDLAMAKAQLTAFNRFKGYRDLPVFQFCGDILEDISIEKVDKIDEKFENNLIENNLSDVTDDAPESVSVSVSVSSSGYKKRKAREPVSDISVKRRKRHPEKVVPTALVSTPKPSFKVGELIQRVASQLTGPSSKVDHGQQYVDQLVGENSQREVSVAEMLSQLHLTAQDPMKDYAFLNTIIPFFYDRRAAVFSKSLKKITTVEKPIISPKRKESNKNDLEEFELEFGFDDANDSYWTDMIVQDQSHLLENHENGGLDSEEYQVVAYEQDSKPKKRGRKPYKKRVPSNNVEKIKVKEESEVDKKRRENSSTEVVLKFTEGINFPCEVKINKMFRRFGPLMESETEVDREGGRARVVFRKCSDAEVAHSSAAKFNIFGEINVNYEINYTPLVSYKPLPLPVLQLQDLMDVS